MYGFSRLYRLVSKHDFQSVFATSKKASHQYLLALYQPNQKPHARLGIIIAKRHVRLAVDRNHLRRIIRESFRHEKEALKGLDIIVLMRSKWSPLDNAALRDDIKRLWQKCVPF
jgi:ribonuclease P protein component